jgi:hypothetical protein
MGSRAVSSFFVALVMCGCGAKTGLLIPDADLPEDAGRDAGIDAGMCEPQTIPLVRRGAQLMFVIDRSNSMAETFDGDDMPRLGESRWELVGVALRDALSDADELFEIGAKFYPRWSEADPPDPVAACAVDEGIDLAPARSNVDSLLWVFSSTGPEGGTPTAMALSEVRDFFSLRPPTIPRFVILATDGGPNCNPDTGVHHSVCQCTGDPPDCTSDATWGPFNCIDDTRTVRVIRDLHDGMEIPVYVIGILDPTRPDLADVLDEMAIAGGRPRDEIGGRRFYDVRDPEGLRGAIDTITDSISRCVFSLGRVPLPSEVVSLSVDGVTIARDASRVDGWDFTTEDRAELTLFGSACARATSTDGDVVATIECRPE